MGPFKWEDVQGGTNASASGSPKYDSHLFFVARNFQRPAESSNSRSTVGH